MSTSSDRDILNIDEAAELLGVRGNTNNKILHAQALPARKIGREWKFSRRALIEWVGSGTSTEFYRENGDGSSASGREKQETAARRSGGWQIELD